MKILSVFGTRPEAIKMAPVVRELAKHANRFENRVCVTAQHREMLDQVLRLFDIRPDYDLNVMQDSRTPTQVAASVMTKIEPVLKEEKPDWVLVQGDTTTVMATAIAAFYAGAKVGHVEAGLRSFDKWQPFPEEINRKVATATADLHFAPTERSRQNLLREGVSDKHICVTGNTVIDALQWVVAQTPTQDTRDVFAKIGGDPNSKWILVTAHRRENFGAPLERICNAIRLLALEYGDAVRFIYPVHLNPNAREPAHRLLGDLSNVSLLPPLDYLPLVHVMKRAHFVLTDSGGIQEEAPSLGKPVLVLRETTERPEAVDAGTVRLVGADDCKIVKESKRLLEDPAAYDAMARAINPYGDGHASERIVSALERSTNDDLRLTS
jgi:UDP-N-acetylglucosamine 2-epimerase (non-hydrolysing)